MESSCSKRREVSFVVSQTRCDGNRFARTGYRGPRDAAAMGSPCAAMARRRVCDRMSPLGRSMLVAMGVVLLLPAFAYADAAVTNDNEHVSTENAQHSDLDEMLDAANDSDIVRGIRIHGDEDWMRRTGLAKQLEQKVSGMAWDSAKAEEAVRELESSAVAKGYYIARIGLPHEQAYSNGVLNVIADAGRSGRRTYSFKDGREDGRYFSRRQIDRRFRDLPEDQPFNYFTFYDRFHTLNAHPDLTWDVDLSVRTEIVDEHPIRYVDMAFTNTRERLPFHAVLDIDNYGTDASDNWSGRLSLQYLNLTKADDVLTFSGQTALDFGALHGVAASYYRPHHLWKGGAFTLYGGYTEVDARDVVPQIDVTGEGWFVGLQGSMRFIDTSRHLMSASLGFVHRYIESGLVVQDYETLPREITIRPLSLALMYSDKTADAWHGRNYVTLEALYNQGDLWGTSDDVEIKQQRVAAEADYLIFRGQVARTQMFGGRKLEDGDYAGRWIAFLRAQGQYADGALIHAEQMGAGGANTVRGYKEREYLGDHAAIGTIELRTPLLLGAFSRLAQYARPSWQPTGTPIDRLQWVAFADAGYTQIEDPLPGEERSQSLVSVGTGFRLAVTQHAQLKFDWGFPLEETVESDIAGRGHVNLQIQF